MRYLLMPVFSAGHLHLDHLRPEILVGVGIERAYRHVLVGARVLPQLGGRGESPMLESSS